jgi:hypothetical protein
LDFKGVAFERMIPCSLTQAAIRVFKRLPDGGGGPRGYVDAIFALQVNNPLGHGKFAATS